MQSPQDAVFLAIEKLAIADHYRWRVPEAVKMLCVSSAVLPMNDAKHNQKAGSNKARASLEELEKHLTCVIADLGGLPLEAHSALQEVTDASGVKHPFWFQEQATAMLKAVQAAREAIPISKERSGRPRMKGAEKFSMLALRVYEDLTGKPASRTVDTYDMGNIAGGPFVQFLRDLFEALEIDASADNQARDAITRAKKSVEIPH
ncbi:hypothetical protein [Mesorhizobium sp.]|uniref:hypothetical protein n=1 Tax=Mesorhizobium sp. TaxID=1871066 RepID=UPI0012276866|nr:hypothetical protein [Mesorhizobium sp.]TIN77485.1 MAG: hypothetical protein E5Y09_17840 [Mesorhizobium sp.]